MPAPATDERINYFYLFKRGYPLIFLTCFILIGEFERHKSYDDNNYYKSMFLNPENDALFLKVQNQVLSSRPEAKREGVHTLRQYLAAHSNRWGETASIIEKIGGDNPLDDKTVREIILDQDKLLDNHHAKSLRRLLQYPNLHRNKYEYLWDMNRKLIALESLENMRVTTCEFQNTVSILDNVGTSETVGLNTPEIRSIIGEDRILKVRDSLSPGSCYRENDQRYRDLESEEDL